MNENILELYNEIFDTDGNILACGREKCKKLINLLSKEFPNINFGDSDTGFMNVEEIKRVLKK